MKRSALQFGILLLIGLAGPVTAEVQTTQTAQLEDRETTRTAQPRQQLPDKNSTGTAAVVASNLPLARVVTQMEHQSKIPIAIKGSAADTKVTVISPRPKPVADLLNQLVASSSDLILKEASSEGGPENKGYEIWRQKEYEKAHIVVKTYPVKSARARDMERFVSMALKSGTETVLADDRLNKLVVNALPESHEKVSRLLADLDQEMLTRIYTIQHRNPKDMTYKLINFFPIAEDQVTYDDASGQVAVRAPIDTLARVEQLIEAFDVPPAQETGSSSTAVRSRR